MTRAVVLGGVVVWLLVLSVPAMAGIHAVAAPSSQTVAINGSAAQFDGSGSYTDRGLPDNGLGVGL